MSIKKFLDSIVSIISEKANKVFTGRMVLTVNFKRGSIANVDVEIKHKLGNEKE